VFSVSGYLFPTTMRHVYAELPNTAELTLIELAENQIVEESASEFDFKDAKSLQAQNKTIHQHDITQTRQIYLHNNLEIVEHANSAIATLSASKKPDVSVREARAIESKPHMHMANQREKNIDANQHFAIETDALMSKILGNKNGCK